MTLKGQGHRSKLINDTIGFLDLKNIDVETKIVILSALVRKLWSKMSFCIMVDNVKKTCLPVAYIAQATSSQ